MAAAVILIASGAALWAAGYGGQHPAHGGQAEVAAVLTAPDATVFSVSMRTGGHATVVMSHHERMLVFAAAGLPGLPRSKCYELWLVGRGGDRAAGLLPMPRHGMSGPAVASGLRPGDRLGLTVEPAGGSARPTSTMIIDVVL
jgi:anti-sigma-K factor RskA